MAEVCEISSTHGSVRRIAAALALFLVLTGGALAQEPLQVAQAASPPSSTAGALSAKIEAARDNGRPTSNVGPAVDAEGNTAVDPTANVVALSRAATQRQDDLREASERFLLMIGEQAEKLNIMRYDSARMLREAETRRINEVQELRTNLMEAESKRVDQIIALRSEHQSQLAGAEAKRIDAIRSVDVNAAQNLAERTVEQANVLQQQVQQSAEALRALVDSTAQSVAAAQEQSTSALASRIEQQNVALTTRLAALEQAQYVGQGQSSQRDPAFVELQSLVKELAAARSVSAGQDTGSSNTIGFIVAGIGVFFGFISMIGVGFAIFRRPHPLPAPPHPPRTVYRTRKASA